MNEQQIVKDHYQSLYRFALSLSKRSYDAEDLVHQTYVKWLKNREKIKDDSRIKSWLFTTLHREFLHGQKTKSRQTLVEHDQLEGIEGQNGVDAGDKMDAQIAMKLMMQVPEPYRASLALFYVQDFSYREIADVLKVAPGTVMSRIYRGKKILKELMSAWQEGSNAELRVGQA